MVAPQVRPREALQLGHTTPTLRRLARRALVLGNSIDPLDIISEYSADALRFSLIMLTATGPVLLETNVRLYGVDEQGRRGVVFSSLEASRLAAVYGLGDDGKIQRSPDPGTGQGDYLNGPRRCLHCCRWVHSRRTRRAGAASAERSATPWANRLKRGVRPRLTRGWRRRRYIVAFAPPAEKPPTMASAAPMARCGSATAAMPAAASPTKAARLNRIARVFINASMVRSVRCSDCQHSIGSGSANASRNYRRE